jgi:ribonuclease P protein component
MSTPRRHTFPQAQRLKSRKQIDALFRGGKTFSVHPVKVFYTWEGTGLPKVGMGAPKRHFRRAVDRNRIKRLLREGYRLQKQVLLATASAAGLHVFLLYTGRDIPTQTEVIEKIAVILKRLSAQTRPGGEAPESAHPIK